MQVNRVVGFTLVYSALLSSALVWALLHSIQRICMVMSYAKIAHGSGFEPQGKRDRLFRRMYKLGFIKRAHM